MDLSTVYCIKNKHVVFCIITNFIFSRFGIITDGLKNYIYNDNLILVCIKEKGKLYETACTKDPTTSLRH